MKFLLVLAFAVLACASATQSDLFAKDAEIEIIPPEGVEIAPQFIVSWQVRRAIRKLQKQMPCGFPDQGIPPLAPLKVSEAKFELKKGILETLDSVFRFRIDGLDQFIIKKFKLNMITSKITFNFIFKDIHANAQKYSTDTLIDALRQIGISVQYEGDGTLDFSLYNLRVAGVLKYKLPILWGSAKITSLKTTVSLEKCNSEIGGFMGDGAINHMINRQIENVVEKGINNNQAAISEAIEDTIVPPVNKMLKGKDFWTLIDLIFSSSEGESEDDPIVSKCVAPADPWA